MSFDQTRFSGSLTADWNQVYHKTITTGTLTTGTALINSNSVYAIVDNAAGNGGATTTLVQSGSSTVPITYARVLFNKNVTISGSNNVFTVPVTGMYQITLLTETNYNGSTGIAEYILVNTASQHNMTFQQAAGEDVITGCFSSSILMLAGDSVSIVGQQLAGTASMFTGNSNNVQFIITLIQQLA